MQKFVMILFVFLAACSAQVSVEKPAVTSQPADVNPEPLKAVVPETAVPADDAYPVQPITDPLPGEKTEAIEELADDPAWPVTIGYFKQNRTDSTEQTPVYEVSFLLYEGGISRKLVMRYPDYSLRGSLVSLEFLDDGDCSIRN